MSAVNSLVGSTINDYVGYDGVVVLTNGNYVVTSFYWDNGAATDAGAVTRGNGTTGVRGVVSSANSLVGTTANDRIGSTWTGYPSSLDRTVTALANGNYVIVSSSWSNDPVMGAGAVTLGVGAGNPTTGVISTANSVLGITANGGIYLNFGYDTVNQQLGGRPTIG